VPNDKENKIKGKLTATAPLLKKTNKTDIH
jgi:hypothetical protein